MIRLDFDGFQNYLDKLHANCAIFTDLGSADLAKELYLVAQIVRVGRILATDATKRGITPCVTEDYRRPLGAGVLALSDVLAAPLYQDEREFSFKVMFNLKNLR